MGALGDWGGGSIVKGLTALSAPAPREGTRSLILQEAMGSSDDEARPHCLACGREGDLAAICQRCAGRIKLSLLDAAKRIMSSPGTDSGRQLYCLQCHEIFSGKHEAHQEMTIPLGWYKGKKVAWATGEEV